MKEEKYTDKVRYFYTRSPHNPVKRYIRVELPHDSFFAPDEFVTVTISGNGNMNFTQVDSEINEEAPYTQLRNMNIGDEISFPYEKWNALRSTASYLKRFYGVLYSVRKSGAFKQKGEIIVTRLK